ncbi:MULTISPECIES: DUF4158 domain-containing protein [Streptosporangium]|uniref:DUF4158 domain-containing protein n=1 Tax=Streptosporangium brasiliense TaxID=47480 RepID=A0ABT9RJE4_9ACTN|nr:DUF4158 domain-containing protein [Streptosporangium brasiliense]MDP9868926.1 hypothetical protein [Streptosporangium brasiliense]
MTAGIDDLQGAPRAVVIRLANQLALHPGVLDFYGRPQPRSDHLKLVAGYLGWRQPKPASAPMKELEQFLLDRAMEHDAPSLQRRRRWRSGPGEARPGRC